MDPKVSQDDASQRWLDTQGAATHALCSESSILRAARRGILKAYKLGSQWRFRPADVDRFIMASRTPVEVRRVG